MKRSILASMSIVVLVFVTLVAPGRSCFDTPSTSAVSLPMPQSVPSYLITAAISQTNDLSATVPCEEGKLTRDDYLTATLSSPVLWDGEPYEGKAALIGDEAVTLCSPDDDNSARFIIILKTSPLAVRLNEIQGD